MKTIIQIKLKSRLGEREVTCDAEVYGVFAVHRLLSNQRFWALTHVPTSLGVIKTESSYWTVTGLRGVAKRLAHIMEDCPIEQVGQEIKIAIAAQTQQECDEENARNGYL